MNIKKTLGLTQAEPVPVDPKNRFYYMLQQMQANRWKITAIVLGLFFFIIAAIMKDNTNPNADVPKKFKPTLFNVTL